MAWCEIRCDKCDSVAKGSGIYYKGIIAELRKNTKDWIIKDGMRLCSDCQKENTQEKLDEKE